MNQAILIVRFVLCPIHASDVVNRRGVVREKYKSDSSGGADDSAPPLASPPACHLPCGLLIVVASSPQALQHHESFIYHIQLLFIILLSLVLNCKYYFDCHRVDAAQLEAHRAQGRSTTMTLHTSPADITAAANATPSPRPDSPARSLYDESDTEESDWNRISSREERHGVKLLYAKNKVRLLHNPTPPQLPLRFSFVQC
jgi:hypothetical protein